MPHMGKETSVLGYKLSQNSASLIFKCYNIERTSQLQKKRNLHLDNQETTWWTYK